MTDRDHSLQDEFDRHFRGDGPPPETKGDPEAEAYRVVFSALKEEPEGDLPADFAERVADRVGLAREPAFTWSDVALLVLAMVGLGATLFVVPSTLTLFRETFVSVGESFTFVSSYLRLDVLVSIALVLLVAGGFDRLIRGWVPIRRAPTPSS